MSDHSTTIETSQRPPLAPTPRPTFDGPTHIPYAEAARHLWGDHESGQVADWIYASTQKIHHLVFGLAPGRSFRHSPDFRTVFAADELLYVLSGTMVLANPQTGEVLKVGTGQAAFFRPDTWHHALSFGDDALRVLEFFAPPPATGSSSTYARSKPYLDASTYCDQRWVGRWPDAALERDASATLTAITDSRVLWSLDGDGTLIGTYVSTEHLTAGIIEQRPGAVSQARCHGGDASLHVVEGTPYVLILSVDGVPTTGRRWYELRVNDGFYVPEGTVYEVHNVNGEAAKLMFAVAPSYNPMG